MTSALRLCAALVVLAIAWPGSTGCQAHLISDYDPYLDQHAAELGTRVSAFILKMEATAGTSAGTYASNSGFYSDTRAELETLEARARIMPKSDLVVRELTQIGENLSNLAKVHQSTGDGGLQDVVAEPMRTALQTQFAALYRLEAALRRGDSASGG